jgi:predicted metalloprotease with PDZ domain
VICVPKNAQGKIQVTFRAHEVTGELMIGLVGNDSPAMHAGVAVGDAVLAIQGVVIQGEGEAALDEAMAILQKTAQLTTVELVLQTRVRMEVLEFGQKGVGGPKNHLGLDFWSLPEDNFVRITRISASAAKSGRFALGDRVVAMNGIRVNHAETLSQLVKEAGLRDDYVTFEVSLGYAAAEGLWFGDQPTPRENQPERKPKRSFSFGRKPRH